MQALTQTVFPCYAAADREIAAGIASFLERGADVRVFLEEGEMRPGENLADKAREARMADIVVVLFSRHSLPSRWPRSEWEGALHEEPAAEGVRIAFVRADDCIPPRVLAPRFDLPRGLRELKRWLRGNAAQFEPPVSVRYPDAGPDLEVLGIAIADRAGVETVDRAALAYEFVREFREDFDAIFRLECSGRTVTALAGDLAAQLGLRLEGDLPSNLERLANFCSTRRFLLLFEGDPPAELLFSGRCSALIAREGFPSPGDELRQVQRAFVNPAADWPELCRLARIGRRLTGDAGRIAELYELMWKWHFAAEDQEDRAVLNESARELVWILESWGRDEEARRLDQRRIAEFDEQMPLF